MRWPAPPHEKRTGGEGAGGGKSVHVGEQLELHLLIAPAADRAGSNARADAAEQGLKQGTFSLHLERSENLISVVYQVTEHSRRTVSLSTTRTSNADLPACAIA